MKKITYEANMVIGNELQEGKGMKISLDKMKNSPKGNKGGHIKANTIQGKTIKEKTQKRFQVMLRMTVAYLYSSGLKNFSLRSMMSEH